MVIYFLITGTDYVITGFDYIITSTDFIISATDYKMDWHFGKNISYSGKLCLQRYVGFAGRVKFLLWVLVNMVLIERFMSV